ncbi:MAG: A/G-specific adenine glycosylase [Mariprofundales bacterium]
MAWSSETVETLSVWYRANGRDLPWRQTRDPYRVWISEIMLQQTQVKTVLPRYSEWLQRFPDLPTLAAASEDAVLKGWEGLGYYRRARLLHRAAAVIQAQHGGLFPTDFASILALPGVGRSTAGAIASSCFDAPYPVLDANVKRVLSRWHGQTQVGDGALWQMAQRMLDAAGAPKEWNQAMMELGACICRARSADCAHCPLTAVCRSAHAVVYVAPKRPVVSDLHWRLHLYRHSQYGVWLQQRPSSGIWASLWTPPIEPFEPVDGLKADLVHSLTHRRLHLYAVESADHPPLPGRWLEQGDAPALPTGVRRLLQITEIRS